jgi:hypothetical protein
VYIEIISVEAVPVTPTPLKMKGRYSPGGESLFERKEKKKRGRRRRGRKKKGRKKKGGRDGNYFGYGE